MTPGESNVNAKLLRVAISALGADIEAGQPLAEEHIISTVRTYAPAVGAGVSEDEIQAVIDELTRRFNIWTGKSATLVGDDPGHRDWLPGKRGEISWQFWNRYRLLLERQLPPRVVSELDEMTDHVLGLLEEPARPGAWRRQGLVVGHVQSGKTGNYTGLICKAADAGYKVIVVLAGIHNSLRSQTQIRLDEGFLGYAREFGLADPRRTRVGVGLIDPTAVADSVTTRDERGDFSKTVAQQVQIHAGGNVLLFVVKKNVRVLRNLIEWAKLSAKKPIADGRNVVGDVPLLVIDDEADQASIDTKVQVFDENGQPDVDHDPSAINFEIRKLLETFERRAYVGYTATPFANVFIHPDGKVDEGGMDLYPRHFIVNLSAPTNYFGPARIFGRIDGEKLPPQGDVPSRVRFIKDSDEWVPSSHKNTHVPRAQGQDRLPESLERAILSFLLASAARRARGQVNEHKSMLVHVTRFTAVQHHVWRQVSQFVEDLRARWRSRNTSNGDPLLVDVRSMWQSDFQRTSLSHNCPTIPWSLVEPHIWPILELLKVNLINAKASDALIYEEHREHGLHVIAIGGDKLSRGLTLEGLTVSYFLRSARMYDTLMQMGRWFGYRPGYEDLCRLYLSQELAEWYGHITDAAEELRQEFDRMVLLGGTPDDFGLRVRTHPVLAITGKLRPGIPTLTTSLSATPFEPTVLLERSSALRSNWEAAATLLGSLAPPDAGPVITSDAGDEAEYRRGNWPGAVLWRGVPGDTVLEFLNRFQFADKQLVRTPSTAVTAYIKSRLEHAELKNWTVVVLGRRSPSDDNDEEESTSKSIPLQIAGRTIWSIYRSRHPKDQVRPGLYTVRRLGSPKDESIDLSDEEWARVVPLLKSLAADPQRPKGMSRGRLIREQRPKERGLLILYLLNAVQETSDGIGADEIPLVAPYVSFPYSKDAVAVSYKLNYRYWEDELGGVE